ncbi:MAG: formate dehydrogenase accessory protein FdhE [Slackia sp.]|nr:formate dehydrogenase accessory protein FdhE [Slackia sp.]
MNMKLIERAIESYENTLASDDRDRLAFFRMLWQTLDARSGEGARASVWSLDAEELCRAAQDGTPLFAAKPACVSLDELIEAFDALVAAIRTSGAYPEEAVAALESAPVRDAAQAAGMDRAGACPEEFLAAFADALLDCGVGERHAVLCATLLSLALRSSIEHQAAQAFSALEAAGAAASSLHCPVCGAAPALAHVGAGGSSAARKRKLVCLQCGTAWEFDRIRCARCGTRDQESLHAYSMPGDDAHRIAVCDECGGSIKTLFSDDMFSICSYEVEDVVMAKLDAAVRAGEGR